MKEVNLQGFFFFFFDGTRKLCGNLFPRGEMNHVKLLTCCQCQQAWNYLVLVSLFSSKVQLLTYRHKPPLFPNAKKQQELSLVLAACVFGALCLSPCAFTWHAWCCTERPLWLFDTALRPVYSHALWTGCSILHNWSLMCTSSQVDLIHHFLDFQTLGGRRVKNERLKSRTQASLKGVFFSFEYKWFPDICQKPCACVDDTIPAVCWQSEGQVRKVRKVRKLWLDILK